jgi:hypothetical protein
MCGCVCVAFCFWAETTGMISTDKVKRDGVCRRANRRTTDWEEAWVLHESLYTYFYILPHSSLIGAAKVC